jgi:hypothetical protein
MDDPEKVFNLTSTGWTAIGSVVSAASVLVLSVFNALFLKSALKQSKIMKDTATDVHQQADWMKTQAEQMTAQTIKLGESIAVAQQGAAAVLSQIKMGKDRERARISVSINDDAVDVSSNAAEPVTLSVSNDGPTIASDVRVAAELFGQPGEGVPFMGNATLLIAPTVIRASDGTINVFVPFSSTPPDLTQAGQRTIDYYFHLSGAVEYVDVFGEKHKTNFRYRSRFTELSYALHEVRKIANVGGWHKTGKPEENEAT